MKYLIMFFIIICISKSNLYSKNLNLKQLDNEYKAEFLINQKEEFINLYGDLAISNFIIKGSKVRDNVIIYALRIKKGEKISKFNPDDAIKRIQQKSLFQTIDLKYLKQEDGVAIEITLKDKFPIIVFPIFAGEGESGSYGAVLAVSRIFGYDSSLALIGYKSNNKQKIILVNKHRDFLGSGVDIGFKLSNADINVISKNTDDTYTFDDFIISQKQIGFDIDYNFNSIFKLSFDETYSSNEFDEDRASNIGTVFPDMKILTTELKLTIDLLNYYYFFNYGSIYILKVTNEYNFDKNLSNTKFANSYNIYNLRGFYRGSLYQDVSYFINFEAETSDANRPILNRTALGGYQNSLTLPPQTTYVDTFVSGTIGFEVPITTFFSNRLLLATSPFIEQGLFKREFNSSEKFYYGGFGISTSLYIKSLAISSFELSFARNTRDDESYIHFNMKRSF